MRGATSFIATGSITCSISTHTPHAGRDRIYNYGMLSPTKFLLTRPMRGATGGDGVTLFGEADFYSHAPCGARHRRHMQRAGLLDFYSHAPCGARREFVCQVQDVDAISTHTPRAGRDISGRISVSLKCIISTHTPRAGRDTAIPAPADGHPISTHTPRAGRDERR